MNIQQYYSQSKQFYQNNSKVVNIVVVVVLIALAVLSGRYTKAAKVITKTETQVVTQTVTQEHTQYVDRKVYVTQENKDLQQTTVTVKKPDGTETTTVTLTDKSKTTQTDTDQASSTMADKTTEDAKTDTSSSKVVINQAQWHMGIDVGAGARFVGQLTPLMSFGVSAERRILGPVFLGLWAKTDLNLVSPGLAPYTFVGGARIGIEF